MNNPPKIYREVILPSFEKINDWREFTLSDEASVVQDTEKNFFGSGYAFKNSSKSVFTRNRFIVWRVIGETLDLMDISLDLNLRGNAIRLRFGATIVPDVIFYEVQNQLESYLVIFVVTSKNQLYRFTFLHPDLLTTRSLRDGENLFDSLFANVTLDQLQEKRNFIPLICRHSNITIVTGINQRQIAVGCLNGTVIVVTLDDVVFSPSVNDLKHEEVELRDVSLFQKLWSGLLPGTLFKSPNHSVCGLHAHSTREDTFVFTLHIDKFLVWSYRRKEVLFSMPIQPKPWDPQNVTAVSRRAMKLLFDDSSTDEFKIVFFLALETESQFQVYWGKLMPSGDIVFQLQSVHYCNNDSLVDFQIANDAIWALWKETFHNEEAFTLKHSILPTKANAAKERNIWYAEMLEDPNDNLELLSVTSTSQNIDELFLAKIFEPGRFSYNNIARALAIFSGNPNFPTFSTYSDLSALRVELVNEIHHKVSMTVVAHGEVDEEFILRTKRLQWVKFLQYCIRCWLDDNAPLGLFLHHSNGLVVLVKKGCVSLMRPQSLLETLQILFAQSTDRNLFITDEQKFALSGDFISPKEKIDEDILTLFACMSFLTSQMGSQAVDTFEENLFYLVEPVDAAESLISWLLGGMTSSETQEMSTEQKQILRSLVINFSRKFKNIRHPLSCFERFLDLVEGHYSSTVMSDVPNPSELSELFGSEIMESVVARAYQQIVHCHFALLRDFIFVLLFLQQIDISQTGLSLKDLSVISQQCLPRALRAVKTFFLARWVSSQRYLEMSTASTVENSIRQFNALHLSERTLYPKSTVNEKLITEVYFRETKGKVRVLFQHHPLTHSLLATFQTCSVWPFFEPFLFCFVELLYERERVTAHFLFSIL
jgi:nuclear pore complex protein Nup160